MQPGFVFGTALTGAVLTFVAAVIGNAAGIAMASVTSGVLIRTLLAVAALTLTAFFWWRLRGHDDRPAALFTGLLAAWILNVGNWTGGVLLGRLFTDSAVVSVPVDLLLWAVIAFALTRLIAKEPQTSDLGWP